MAASSSEDSADHQLSAADEMLLRNLRSVQFQRGSSRTKLIDGAPPLAHDYLKAKAWLESQIYHIQTNDRTLQSRALSRFARQYHARYPMLATSGKLPAMRMTPEGWQAAVDLLEAHLRQGGTRVWKGKHAPSINRLAYGTQHLMRNLNIQTSADNKNKKLSTLTNGDVAVDPEAYELVPVTDFELVEPPPQDDDVLPAVEGGASSARVAELMANIEKDMRRLPGFCRALWPLSWAARASWMLAICPFLCTRREMDMLGKLVATRAAKNCDWVPGEDRRLTKGRDRAALDNSGARPAVW